MEHVSATELARRSGATYRQIDYWARTGLIHADRMITGSGHRRRFPESEIAVAAALVAVSRITGNLRDLYENVAVAARDGERGVMVEGTALIW